jgi:hypothetical protein
MHDHETPPSEGLYTVASGPSGSLDASMPWTIPRIQRTRSEPMVRSSRNAPSGSRDALACVLGIGLALASPASAITPPLSGPGTDPPARRVAPDPTSEARAVPAIPREGPLAWGIYQILWSGRAFTENLDREIERLGRPDYVTFFRDLVRPYPREICAAILERGAIPIISMELHRWGEPEGNELRRIADGAYDDYFARYARDARESEQDVWFRFAFEMNGDWFTWGHQPETFKIAWRRIHEIFRREGARNVVWVWSPNAISGPDTPSNGIEAYWPGDALVDVIGLDGYNFGDGHSEWHRWCSFEEIFEPALEKIRESGVSHPVFITEFGCTDDAAPARRAEWIRDAFAYLSRRPEVVGALWFNHDKRREGEHDWRIAADALSLRAWRETFAAGPG